MESSGIFLLMIITGITTFGHNPEANKKTRDAYIRYTGADDMVSSYTKKIQNDIEKEAPEEVRFYIGGAIYLSKTILERKIVIKWTF